MALFELLYDTPKDRVSVLRYRKQMAEDARKLGPKEFEKKYGSMDAEDRKAFLPNSKMDIASTFDYFKNQDPATLDKLITNEEKRIQIRTAESDKITQQAMQIAPQIKQMVQGYANMNKIKGDAAKNFGYNIGENVDPVQIVNEGMVAEANRRIRDGEGISLSQDPKNDMTCIAGVCTLAANQGVDFSKLQGMPGVVKDKQGRSIPQYNPTFTSAISKTGYQELPKGEKPRQGDIVQYFKAKGNTRELVPKHMELVTSGAFKMGAPGAQREDYETFNNYALYSDQLYDLETEGAGREKRPLNTNPDGTFTSGGWDQVRFYRLTPEAAEKAVRSKNPDAAKKLEGKRMFEQSDMAKAYQEAQQMFESGRGKNILGDDQGLLMEIVEGAGGKFANDRAGLKKVIASKAKNPVLVQRVIDQIYEANQ